MYNKSWRNRVVLFAFIFLLFAQLLPFATPQAEKVYADSNLDKLCVLPTKDLGSGDNHEQKGWLQVQFINRALIRVKFVGSGNCVSPSGNNMIYIAGNKKFSDVIDGDYYDKNTADNSFSYVKADGASDADDSQIDEFGSGLGKATQDDFGGQDKTITVDTIRSFIGNVEFTLSVEEDQVDSISCSSQNGNFVYTNTDNDGKGFLWTCTSGDSNIDVYKGLKIRNAFEGRLENFNITYNYQDGKLVHVSESERDTRTFMYCESSGNFRSEGCSGPLYIDATKQQMETLGTGTGTFALKKDGQSKSTLITVAGSTSPSSGATAALVGNSGISNTGPSCESEGGSLSFIICPLFELGDAVVRQLDEAVVALLRVPNSYLENDSLKIAWSRIRDVAYLILVPIVLVMVIATALGFEIVSAYTVKRALPRLITAVIFIALSFEVTKFLIIMTNNIGTGISSLIMGAFAGTETITLSSIFNPDQTDSIASLPIFAGAITAGLFLGSIGIVMSYMFVMLIGLAIGFFLLSLRQMLLIALMLLAPVAILSWIFPGNDKLWKLWWGAFSKLLLLFPLIMVLIATGKSFALLVSETEGNFVATLMKLVAYVGPYFLIPATFKFAGGAFATLSGMANDRGRGLFDRQKKYRQGKASENWAKSQAGTKFNRGGLNAFTSRATTRGFGMTNRGKQAYQQKMDLASIDHAKSAQGQAAQHNDGVLRAQTYSSEAQARAKMADDFGMNEADINTAVMGAKANGGWGVARQIHAAKQLSATGTGYDNLEQVAATIARVSGGNESQIASLAGDINASTKQAGRPGLAPGFGKLREISMGAAGIAGGSTDFNGARIAASRGMDAVSILRGKPKDVENLTGALSSHLKTQRERMNNASTHAERSEASMEVKKTIGQITQLDQAKSYASVDNQMHVNGLVHESHGEIEAAKAFFDSQPNAAKHRGDIERFSIERHPDASSLDAFSPDSPYTQQ